MVWIIQLLICFLLLKIRKSKEKRGINKKYFNDTLEEHSRFRLKNKIFSIINGIEKWTIYRISKVPSHLFRNFCYKNVLGITLKKDSVVYAGTLFRRPSKISIGEGTIIGDHCTLDGRGGLTIGSNCNLSSEVHIWTAQHDLQGKGFDYIKKPVVIGDRCWISSNTVILPGVTVGDGVVLAAGAVLSKNAEPYSIYAGVPARKIGERNKDLKYNFDGSHDWFM